MTFLVAFILAFWALAFTWVLGVVPSEMGTKKVYWAVLGLEILIMIIILIAGLAVEVMGGDDGVLSVNNIVCNCV